MVPANETQGWILVDQQGNFFGTDGFTPLGSQAMVYFSRRDALYQACKTLGSRVVPCSIRDHGFSYEECRESADFISHIAAPCGRPE